MQGITQTSGSQRTRGISDKSEIGENCLKDKTKQKTMTKKSNQQTPK